MPRIPDNLSDIRGFATETSGIGNKVLAVSYTGRPVYRVLLYVYSIFFYVLIVVMLNVFVIKRQ